MIQSTDDYRFYLEADRLAMGIHRQRPSLFFHEVWKFERLLRKVEYYKNCRNAWLYRPYYLFLLNRFHRMSVRMGYHIPPNVFGPGLSIMHWGSLIVSSYARVGENCRVHNNVHIGSAANNSRKVPKIGNNVFIGPGARIFGDIEIADGIAIGANAVVNRSFLEPHITIAGIPAQKVSDEGSEGIVVKATDLVRMNTPGKSTGVGDPRSSRSVE
jgi:serine O-acetyltransferase